MKYFKGNFLPGREFVDDVHLHEQLAEWMATIADVRIHGTTHERPLDRFAQEQPVLLPTTRQPSFRLEAPLARIVADDWLVSVDTNRYSVPFMLIGQPVEIHRRNGRLRILHRGTPVAEHQELLGKHQVRILPEHGPGASARTARRQHSTPAPARSAPSATVVEIRDLAVYDALLGDTEVAAPGQNVAPEATAALDPMRAEVSA